MATSAINAEMDFTWELARNVAPDDVSSKYARRGRLGGLGTARLRKKNVTKISDTAENG